MNKDSYYVESNKIEQTPPIQIIPTPCNETDSNLQFEPSSASYLTAETLKIKILKLSNFKKIYTLITSDSLYKDSLFQMASTLILASLGFVFWIIIAHLYKAINVGIATTLISILLFLSYFSLLGLNSSL